MTRHAPTRAWLPVEPLLAHLPIWEGKHNSRDDGYAAMGGVNSALSPSQQRALYRAKHDGRLTFGMADELALALGYHPVELWGELWWQEATG